MNEKEEPEPLQAKRADESIVQRQEDEEEGNEEEAELKTQPDEEEQVQAKTSGTKSGSIAPVVERGIQSLRGSGQPLSASSRAYFEPRFGADFSEVKVRNDLKANYLARSINAKAFALGHDVIFGAGHYAPETDNGKRLMAHELTHVIQQRGHKKYGSIHMAPCTTYAPKSGYRNQRVKTRRRDASNLVLRKVNRIHAQASQCARARGVYTFILSGSGINTGYTYIRQREKVFFYNMDNKTHRIKIVPAGLFTTNYVNVGPRARATTRTSATTAQINGSIVDDVPAATSGSIHDVTVCP